MAEASAAVGTGRLATVRLTGIDLARAIALLGMMLAHLGPPWSGQVAPPVSEWLAGGRSAALFAVLAGLSVGLMTRFDPRGLGARAGIARRGAALLLIGLALASLPNLTVLVILPCYGMLVAATALTRNLSTRALAILGVSWCGVSPFVLFAIRQVVDEPVTPLSQPSFGGGLSTLPIDLFVWGGYPALVWFGYVLVGSLLARFDLTDVRVARRLVVGGAVATAASLWIGATALAFGALEEQWGPARYEQLFWSGFQLDPHELSSLWAVGPHTSTPLNVIGVAGSACLVIGLCLWVCSSGLLERLTGPLRAAGSMTLTLYCLHVVLVWANREHQAAFTGEYYPEWWVQVLLLVTLAWLWRSLWPRGPLEQLVRSFSLARLRRVGAR